MGLIWWKPRTDIGLWGSVVMNAPRTVCVIERQTRSLYLAERNGSIRDGSKVHSHGHVLHPGHRDVDRKAFTVANGCSACKMRCVLLYVHSPAAAGDMAALLTAAVL